MSLGLEAQNASWHGEDERALGLLAAGRDQEALGWYEGLLENTVAELVFSGPALLRAAAIHGRAGHTEQAGALEERFRSLWADADPDLRVSVRARFGEMP